MSDRPSRFWQFMFMLPFFMIGVAVPVYFHGFSGDGPPNFRGKPYSPIETVVIAPSSPSYAAYPKAAPSVVDPENRSALVDFFRRIYDGFVDRNVSASLSPATIKLAAFLVLFVTAFLLVRLALALASGALGAVLVFLVHKAAAPMFMGFLAVGSTWGIHQTIAGQFGLNWAAATVTLTAAIASLFSLAGLKLR